MSQTKRYNFKNILVNTVWTLVGVGTMVLLIAAMYKKNSNHCKAVEINIEGVKDNFFTDKSDVKRMLDRLNFKKLDQRPLNSFNLAAMEAILEKNVWIKSAELYFDNNDVLRINITEREPIVRIFTSNGSSYYIDSSLAILPLSDKFSARLPVFTNFPIAENEILKADSNLLRDIKNIGTYILQDPFWMAQIEQTDISPGGSFEMVPKVGNHLIIFGSADNYKQKFSNLLLFYMHVESKVGWNKYSQINVSYNKQVVAVKRGAGDIKLDSMRTLQLLKQLVANEQKQANDTINNIQLVQPKDENIIPLSQPHDENFMEEQPLFTDSINSQISDKHLELPATKKPKANNINSAAASINLKSQSKEINYKPIEKQSLPAMKKAPVKSLVKKISPDTIKRFKAVMPARNEY